MAIGLLRGEKVKIVVAIAYTINVFYFLLGIY